MVVRAMTGGRRGDWGGLAGLCMPGPGFVCQGRAAAAEGVAFGRQCDSGGVGGRKEVQMQLPNFLQVVVVVAVVMVTALPPATGRQGVLSRPTPNPPINKIPRSTGWYRRNDGCLVCILPKNTPRDMQRRAREPGEVGRGCSRVLFLLPNPMGHPPSTSSADERMG